MPAIVFRNATKPSRLAHFSTRCKIPCTCHAQRHLNVQKWSEPGAFHILTSKCASRHNGAHFFDSATSKSAPKLRCFVHVLTWKCASRHNDVHFFDIATSKSVSNLVCFVHFDFEMCFAPQRRAIFPLIWPAGSAPAALASLLFDPPESQIIGKKPCFATFLPFRAPGSYFF